MKFTNIESSAMPKINESVKHCINQGRWFLYKVNDEKSVDFQSQCKFILKIGNELYALSGIGEILAQVPLDDSFVMDEIVYFSDMERPSSLSNMNISHGMIC
ncbi:MAG: hypothetical protein Sw2LagTSB_02980 [Shewanella algae]